MNKNELSPKARLLKNSKLAPNGRLIWTGSYSPNGYGITEDANGRPISAHRLAWQVANRRAIPETHDGRPSVIEHLCSEKGCIHSGHLRLSNQQRNMAHPVTRSRQKNAAGRRGPALPNDEREGIHKLLDDGWTVYQISRLTGRSEQHLGKVKQAYETFKLQNAQTLFIKQINARLTDLLFPNRVRKPSGDAPFPSTGGACAA